MSGRTLLFADSLNCTTILTIFDGMKNGTEDPRYNDSVCYERFCYKIEFAVVKKLDRTHLKHQ